MVQVTLASVKRGDFFHMVDNENSPLWIRGEFERSCKKYSVISYDDSCKERFFKGSKIVFVDC